MAFSLSRLQLLTATRSLGSIRGFSVQTKTKDKEKEKEKERKRAKKRLNVDPKKGSLLEPALSVIKAYAVSPFDETVELIVETTIKRGEALRGRLHLPHDTGKRKKILVFAAGEKAEEAKAAGAATVGGEELIAEIAKGKKMKGYDIAYTTPSLLKSLAVVAKTLGKRSIMPQTKRGTVTDSLKESIGDAIKSLDYKTDKDGAIRAGVAKVSFTNQAIQENVSLLVQSIKNSSATEDDFGKKKLRKKLFRAIWIKSTFSPCIQLQISQFGQD